MMSNVPAAKYVVRLHPARARASVRGVLLAAASASAATCAFAQSDFNFRVSRDVEWTALLDRDHGWNAADGCISIPLNGIEAPGLDPHPRTLFTFGDSIIGDVDANGIRLPGNEFINNSMLAVDGREPTPARSRFIYTRNDGTGHPASAFIPATPDAEPGDYFWLMDGIVLAETLHIYGIHLRPAPNGGWPLNQGITMISMPADSRPPFADQVQTKVPLYHPPSGDVGPYQFPSCFVSNTFEAGAPFPDGYIYVYGAREDPFVKKAIVARVQPETFTDYSTWRYFDGIDWVEGITNAAPMTGRISGVYSVVPLQDGRALMVFQQDTIGPNVAIRVGASLTGPWGPLREIYHCPEPDIDPDIYCYNASAHPHLSTDPNELLISYSVNCWDFFKGFKHADIGRPRFIRLTIDP